MCIYICLNWLKIKEKNDAKICSEILDAVVFRIFSRYIYIYSRLYIYTFLSIIIRLQDAKKIHISKN